MMFGKKAFFGYEVRDAGQVSWFANQPNRDQLTLAQAREVCSAEWLRVLKDAFAAERTSAAAIIAATSPETSWSSEDSRSCRLHQCGAAAAA